MTEVKSHRLVLAIDGMTCSSCASTIKHALEGLPTVKNVNVVLSTNSASLEYEPGNLQIPNILTAIEENGFDGKVLQDAVLLPSPTQVKKLLIEIDGMTCTSCTSTVQSALQGLPSVRDVTVSLATNTTTLEYDPAKISSKQIIEEIEANGFDGKILNDSFVLDLGKITSSTSTNRLRKLTVAIGGMTCSSCTSTVESAVSKIKGVEEIIVSLSTNSASVLYDPSHTQSKDIIQEIEDVGFEAKVLNEEEMSHEIRNEGNTQEVTTKSLLLTVTTVDIPTSQLEEYASQLQSLPGVLSATVTDPEDCQITVNFLEKLAGPRKFYGLAKRMNMTVTVSSMGSFLMATRLLKQQQREMKEQQALLLLSIILSIPIVILGMVLPLFPQQHFTRIYIVPGLSLSSFLQFVLATPIQFYIGHRFNKKALMSFRTKTFGMDFMISTGTIASYVYSVITLIKSMIKPSSMNMMSNMASESSSAMEDTYFDTTAVLITAVLFGKYLEIYAKGRTTEAIHKLSSLRAKTARLVGTMLEDFMLAPPSSYDAIPEDEFLAVNEAGSIPSEEVIIDASLLHKFDVIRLVTGEVIPADGVLLSGSHISVNESLLTGESLLIPKKEFDFIHGGATVVEGSALLRVMNVGDETTLGKIIQTVQEAQISKPKIQEIADKIASYFVPVVMMISLLTFLVWIIFSLLGFVPPMWYEEISGGGGPFLLSFTFALSVWVSACPCAFGLATPTAVLVATGVAAKYGILIRKGAALQTASEIDTICFDKTGTLTRGCTEVTDCYFIDHSDFLHTLPYYDEVSNDEESTLSQNERKRQEQDQNILQYFLSLFTGNRGNQQRQELYDEIYYSLSLLQFAEKRSNHPLAKGITVYCQHLLAALDQPSLLMKLDRSNVKSSSKCSLPTEEELLFDIIPGQGVCMYTNPSTSTSSTVQVLVGNIHLLQSKGITIPRYVEEISNGFTAGGKVSIYFSINNRLSGIISVADKVRPETVSVLRQLQRGRKIDCYMVTGDQQSTAIAIGSSTGIETSHILAGVKPEEKEMFIAALQAKGKKVAFVGDGTNDGPALARANVGIAMASGSEIAIEAGDLLLCNNHLQTLITTLDLSSYTLWRIKMNYLWAFGYNVCLIPLAAGVLFPFFHFALQPMYAGAVMALSSVSIVFSSLTITLFQPKTGNKTEDSCWGSMRKTFIGTALMQKKIDKKFSSEDEQDRLRSGSSDGGVEMPGINRFEEEKESDCHCPVSNVPLLEENDDDERSISRTLSDIIIEVPLRLRKLTRSISRNVYRRVNSGEEEGKEHEVDDSIHQSKKADVTQSENSARAILDEYQRQQTPKSLSYSMKSQKRDIILTRGEGCDVMNPLLIGESVSSKERKRIEEMMMKSGGSFDRAMGCGCGGDNCRCFGQCKCGLRKRT